MVSSTAQRVDRLLAFLESDPQNLTLLADAAGAALEDGRASLTGELVDRYVSLAAPPPALVNLAGLAAMREGRYDDAALHFETATAAAPEEPAPRYNLAWAQAARKQWVAVAELLDETVALAIPAAMTLKVQALHQLGEPGAALAWGAGFADRYPDDLDLLGALASAAMDAEEPKLAAAYAERGGDAPEALAVLGLLRLEEARVEDSIALFDRALAANPDSGRALLGKGLTCLVGPDPLEAARLLDRAAQVFGDHLGSWIAAGWAYFAAGDLVRARQRFETARALDDTFAEAHGAIAALDVLDRRFEEARRGAEVALRLDRACFSGELARSLLLDAEGDTATAQRVRNTALAIPVGPAGQTLAQMVSVLAQRRRTP